MKTETYEELAKRTEAPITGDLLRRLQHSARPMHAVIGLTTEVGELADAFKRHIYYGKPLDRINVCEEIGDLLWYLAILCDCMGTTIAKEQAINIEKLKSRYPDKFTNAAALNRDLAAERATLEGAQPETCGLRLFDVGGEG